MSITQGDTALSQLNTIRDASVMRQVFADALTGCYVHDCSLIHARYKPGKSCLVSYRVGVARRAGKPPEDQIFSARVYPAGQSSPRLAKARRAPLVKPAFGEPVFHLQHLDTIVWAFPNDRKLFGLPALLDRKRVTDQVLQKLLAGGCRQDIRAVDIAVVQYVPEHGCTVRLVAQAANGRCLEAYGKTYPDERGRDTYGAMEALWRSEARKKGRLHMARPLLYETDHRILWQSGVQGPMLSSFESPDPQFLFALTKAASTIAALHSTVVTGLDCVRLDDLLPRLREAEQRLQRSGLVDVNRLSALVEAMAKQAPSLPVGPICTLHGDLHWKNVLLTEFGAALIDFDNLRAGDPVQDLAGFIASTCARGIVHQLPQSFIAQMVQAVVCEYRRNASWKVSTSALRWHIAAGLMLEQMERTLVRLKERRLANLSALFGFAEDVFHQISLREVL
jgi:thiamine kinase-like enzyme